MTRPTLYTVVTHGHVRLVLSAAELVARQRAGERFPVVTPQAGAS